MKTWFGWLVVAIVSWTVVLFLKSLVPLLFIVAWVGSMLVAWLYKDVTPMLAVGAVTLMTWAVWKERTRGAQK